MEEGHRQPMPDLSLAGSSGGAQTASHAGRGSMGWMTGLIVLFAVIVGIAVYIGASSALGIVSIWAGFAFALYWGGILHGDLPEMPSALAGSLLGIAIAAALHFLPILYGGAGLAIALAIVVAAVYLLLMGRASFVIHNGTMLFLTIGTIPAVAESGDFPGMAASAILAAALFAGLGLTTRALAIRRKRLAAT